MALSTLRIALRPGLLNLSRHAVFTRQCVPMASSSSTAQDEMNAFWEKNLRLNRPNSPWTIYRWHMPMTTSFCHRITGISMGVALYTLSIGLFVAPGDFTSYLEMIQSWQLSPAILFPLKMVASFPLIYHYINGIRHLTWDFKGGYELGTQYKTGYAILGTSALLAAIVSSMAYW